MLDAMGKSKRRSGSRGKHVQSRQRYRGLTEPARLARGANPMAASSVLEGIERVRQERDEADAELAVLIDRAVGLGIGVNGTRILTPWRHLKSDPLHGPCWLSVVGCGGRGD